MQNGRNFNGKKRNKKYFSDSRIYSFYTVVCGMVLKLMVETEYHFLQTSGGELQL